jgi:hypothetical protein
MGHTACTEPQCLYSRAIPLLPLWAVLPVQSLSACRVELYLYSPYGPYGLYRASVPVQEWPLPSYTFWIRHGLLVGNNQRATSLTFTIPTHKTANLVINLQNTKQFLTPTIFSNYLFLSYISHYVINCNQNYVLYRMSIESIPDYKLLLQENYVE